MAEYIDREAAIKCCTFGRTSLGLVGELRRIPAADVRPVPEGGIGDLSDVLITVDEIKKMLEDAYNEGVADGKAGVQNRPPLTYDDLLQRNVPTIDPNDFRWELTCKGD